MNIRSTVFHPASAILADHTNWLFDGPGVDAFTTSSRSEAEKHAEDLNSNRQRYGVIEFNAVEGWSRPVTDQFWQAAPDDVDEDEQSVRRHIKWMREQSRAFG